MQPSSQVVQNSSKTNNQIITKNIPTIEQLWLNEAKKTQNQDVLIKNTPKQIKQPIINQVIKKTKNNSTQKIEKQKENKPKEQILVIQQTEVQRRQETPQIKNENINQNKTVPKEEEIKAQNKSKEDWNNYKVALRQALFNNLAVTSVVGSGECVIEFAIQKDGKIIQRSFSSQSPNETVNQAVYNMMMKLPYYYAPPSFYNGDKIKMKFLFKNGTYEISYI